MFHQKYLCTVAATLLIIWKKSNCITSKYDIPILLTRDFNARTGVLSMGLHYNI